MKRIAFVSLITSLGLAGCGAPEDADLTDEEIGSVVSAATIPSGWKMPWASGSTYAYTGGPHNGSSLTPCATVTLAGSSGLDFGLNSKEVLGVQDGTLRDWGDNGNTPPKLKWVIIDHGNGWTTRYWHLGSIDTAIQNLTKGKSFISQGRLLGVSGSPDNAPHLHLELRYDNSPNTWHGQSIDGWRVRAMPLQANLNNQINYQGTLTKGTETASNINYAFCSNAAVQRWSGATQTIEAGDATGVSSSNTRRTANQTNLIADEGSNFAKYGPSQYWYTAAIGYNNQMWWTYSNGTVKSNYARWTLPSSMGAGYYKIYAYIPANNATTLSAKYLVVHNGVSEYAPNLNQNRNSDVWVRVGSATQTYYFSGTGSQYVELSDATGEAAGTTKVGVDALIFVKQ